MSSVPVDGDTDTIMAVDLCLAKQPGFVFDFFGFFFNFIIQFHFLALIAHAIL